MTLKLKVKKLSELQSKTKGMIHSIESDIQDKCDFEIFIEHHQSDGFMVMSDDTQVMRNVATGMSLKSVIDIIEEKGRLTKDDWFAIG